MLRLYRLKNYNIQLVFLLLIISGLGVALVSSAQESLQNRQVFGVILGIVAMIIVSLIDYSWVLNFYWFIYFFNIALLLFVRLFGDTTGGATRWLDIAGFRFQPTEPAKIMLILFFAKFLMDHENNLNTIKTIFLSVALLATPIILVLIQPDLKNTITIMAIFCLLMYVAGLSYKIIGGTILVAAPLLIIYLVLVTQTDLPIIQGYQKVRIMAFFNSDDDQYQDKNSQQDNSIIAIGSGQLKGKGLKNNEVSANNGNFVSQIQTDFIFAVAGEELGFVGGAVLIILEFLISIECILTSRKAKDLSGTLICCGVGSVIALQSFINICVATGLFPNTGTPLPFVSYGLTSLVSLYIGAGFVLNVGLQNRTYPGGEKA